MKKITWGQNIQTLITYYIYLHVHVKKCFEHATQTLYFKVLFKKYSEHLTIVLKYAFYSNILQDCPYDVDNTSTYNQANSGSKKNF